VRDERDGSVQIRRGNIISMKCSVKFRVFLPVFNDDGEPSATSMAIICEGEHSHPPPPPRKLPPTARQECINVIKAFDLSEATA
jgi:hypothetical protein